MPACLLNAPSRPPFQANPFGWATAVQTARYLCKLRAGATEVLVRRGKIIGVGRNYVEHAAELGTAVPERPLLFFKPPTAVIGDGDPIVLPPESTQVDFEAEIGVVIGARLRRGTQAQAPAAIPRITRVNDGTARGIQRRDGQWARAKGFDTFCPVGP